MMIFAQNAQHLGVKNVALILSDWFSELSGQRFDVIVSNPPYVATGDPHLSQGDVRFEPLEALAAPDLLGLDCIRSIVECAPGYLNKSGWLLLEHGYDQAQVCCNLLRQSGFERIATANDLTGIPRVSGGRLA